MLLTIAGIDRREFDDYPYYVAKRLQREIALHSAVPTTIVKSTQFHEFATNPAAVTFSPNEIVAEDWLIQPIAADTVAEVLVVAATSAQSAPRAITGPGVIRLPDLTSKVLDAQGDHRRVRAAQPPVAALAEGALLAPSHAVAIGPTIDTWLDAIKAKMEAEAEGGRSAATSDEARERAGPDQCEAAADEGERAFNTTAQQ